MNKLIKVIAIEYSAVCTSYGNTLVLSTVTRQCQPEE